MIEVQELRLSAIGRFVEEQVIQFDKLGNLVQVDGIRNDTSGSSGSGKSTVFNALDYVFGLNDTPSSVLQSRFTKDGISVTVKGTSEGKPMSITRGKGKLIVDLDGEITTGSKLAEEKIDQILGMPRDLFRPLLHKRQKEGGFFLKFTPAQIHSFLIDCLGLGSVRQRAELVDKKLKTLDDDIVLNRGLLNQAKSGLEATDSAAAALGSPPVREVDQDTILALKAQYEAAQEALKPIQTRHTLENSAYLLSKPQLQAPAADQKALQALEAELSDNGRKTDEVIKQNNLEVKSERDRAVSILTAIQAKKTELVHMNHAVSLASTAKADAMKLAGEIKKIRESICPTCEQGWATDAAKTREALLMSTLMAHKATIAKGDQAAARIEAIRQEIAALEPEAAEKPVHLPGEYTVLRIAQDEIKLKISGERQRIRDWENSAHAANRTLLETYNEGQRALTERQTAELQQVSGQIDLTRRNFEASIQKYKFYETSKAVYDRSLNSHIEQKKLYEGKVVEYQTKVIYSSAQAGLCEELKRALKAYTSCSFDEALDYIGTAATEIIRAIPNMANATIQLEGTKETKEGKVKEEVNAVINMDGETAIPIKSLSGGERSSVDLAVDLAVIDLLENRSNKGINIFILDEPFTGLDTVSIEMAIDKLKSLNKRLIIVDHNPEIKQMVESRLLVVRDGLTSKIVQN